MSASTLHVVAGGDPAGWPHWLRVLSLGALWGVAVGTLEALSLPVDEGRWFTFWVLLMGNLPILIIVGMAFAVAVEFAAARVERPWVKGIAVLALAVVLSAAWSWLLRISDRDGLLAGISTIFPQGPGPLAAFLYQTWVIVFYGGLFLLAWTLNHRAERTRSLLRQAESVRVRTEALLGDAQLRALRGHIDPTFLKRVVDELERRYENADADAEQLIRQLVLFLRLAMPGIRNEHSTLAHELALARAYLKLGSMLEPGRVQWSVETLDRVPALPFPPLLLLPLLDSLVELAPAGHRGTVSLVVTQDSVAITFECKGSDRTDQLAPELRYRIGVGMSTLYGDRWSLAPRRSASTRSPALELIIRETASVHPGAELSFPSTGGAQA